MKRNLSQLFRGDRLPVWVFDGAMGSLLQRRGLEPGECLETLNLERPELILQVHREYVAAGADIIQTNTFGGNALLLAKYGLADRTTEINAKAVELAREAAADQALVAASVGPTGGILEPYGEATRDCLFDAFQAQARGLADVDMVNIETMISIEEALLAVEAVRSVLDKPVCLSMTFSQKPTGFFTMIGDSIAQCVERIGPNGVDMIGSNCGEGLEQILAIITEMRGLTTLPLLAKPNAGLPEVTGAGEVYQETPDSFTRKMRRIMEAGATLCGGCCGTSPEYISAVRQLADEFNADQSPGDAGSNT